MKTAITTTALSLWLAASLSVMSAQAQDRSEESETPEHSEETEDVKIDCDALPSGEEFFELENEMIRRIQELNRTEAIPDMSWDQPGHSLEDWSDESDAIRSFLELIDNFEDVSVCYPEDINRILERHARPEEKIED